MKKPLRLSKETLRDLSKTQLADVRGGKIGDEPSFGRTCPTNRCDSAKCNLPL